MRFFEFRLHGIELALLFCLFRTCFRQPLFERSNLPVFARKLLLHAFAFPFPCIHAVFVDAHPPLAGAHNLGSRVSELFLQRFDLACVRRFELPVVRFHALILFAGTESFHLLSEMLHLHLQGYFDFRSPVPHGSHTLLSSSLACRSFMSSCCDSHFLSSFSYSAL